MSELKPLIQEVLHMDRKQRRLSILVVEGEADKLDSSGNRRSYLHYGGGGRQETRQRREVPVSGPGLLYRSNGDR